MSSMMKHLNVEFSLPAVSCLKSQKQETVLTNPEVDFQRCTTCDDATCWTGGEVLPFVIYS